MNIFLALIRNCVNILERACTEDVEFRRKYEFCQQEGRKKMAKSARKKTKGARPAKGAKEEKKPKKAAKGQTKAAEYVGNLLELHKLQGALLTQLRREV